MNVSAEVKYSTTYDARRKQFINYKSRRQPYVLCQIQEFRPENGLEGFKPRKVRVGKFLADTGAQINVGTYDQKEMQFVGSLHPFCLPFCDKK